MKETLEQALEHIADLEHKIANGDVKKALKLARSKALLPDQEQIGLQLLARWSMAERQMLEALISEEDLRIERSKVTKQFLTFLKTVKAQLTKATKDGNELSIVDGIITVPDYEGKPQILVLYATEDKAIWEQLKKHLFLSLRDDTLQFVDVHQAVPFTVKDKAAYQEKLVDAARIVLTLVTPNVLTLPIYSFAEQALVGGKLIPIRVKEIEIKDTPFRRDIKGLPNDGRFVEQWPNPDSAWVDVTKTLRAFFEKIKAE